MKLPYLNGWHKKRAENAARYKKLFEDTPLIKNDDIKLPFAVYEKTEDSGSMERNYHIYNQYVLRVKKRDTLRDWLVTNNIGCEVYYPVPLHKQECLGSLASEISCPEAEKAAKETIALPIYPELTSVMQEYIVEKIVKFYA